MEDVEKTGYSQATVYRAIKELEVAELIDFTEDSRGRPCVYLRVPWFSHSENEISQSEKNNSQSEKRSNKGTVKEPSKKQRTVSRKAVSEDELALAAAVVEQFNNSAGTALSTEAHLTPIVGRIRERPHYTIDHHRRIIEAVFAGDHWWTGPPTPKIIYGNPSIFEQSIELARARGGKAKAEDPNAERRRVEREFREAEAEDEGEAE